MAVSLGSDGWTQFAPSADSRIVYVSSSEGLDSNSDASCYTTGTVTQTPAAAKQTIAAGKALLRTGFPDWLLLKKGDTWVENLGGLSKSGRSADEPILISSFGTGARPLLKATRTARSGTTLSGANSKLDYVAIVDLEFYGHDDDPNGAEFVAPTTVACPPHLYFVPAGSLNGLLIEGCRFRFGSIEIQPIPGGSWAGASLKFRRNVVADTYAFDTVSHRQGLYASLLDFIVLEENVFDHCGWSEEWAGGAPTKFNHNVYLQYDCTIALARGNIFARASSHGIQQRPGGLCYDNLAVNNAIGLLVGGGDSVLAETGQAASNVVLESKDIDGSNLRGWGIEISPTAGGGTGPWYVTNNIIANSVADPSNQHGISLSSATVGVSVENNIVYQNGTGSNRLINAGTGNVLSGNELDGTGYPDPTRSVATYMASLGMTASLDAFLTEARLQSKDNWRTAFTAAAVNNYIRAGFGKSTSAPVRLRLV